MAGASELHLAVSLGIAFDCPWLVLCASIGGSSYNVNRKMLCAQRVLSRVASQSPHSVQNAVQSPAMAARIVKVSKAFSSCVVSL